MEKLNETAAELFWSELTESDRKLLKRGEPKIPTELKDALKKGVHPKNSLNDLTGTEWIRLTRSWFMCDGKKSDIPHEIEDHPASFPPDVPQRFILLFTKRGQTVLDPFVGIGSTLVACQRAGRYGIGIELVGKYARYAEQRVSTPTLDNSSSQKVIVGDALKLDSYNLPPIDLCVTSPPYWNMLRTSRGGVKSSQKQRMEEGWDTVYSDKPEDFGNIDNYEEYLQKIRNVFEKVFAVLKEKGYLVIILQNIRVPDGQMIPVSWDIARCLSDIYTLKQEQIWLQSQKFMGIWGYPNEYVSNVHHHYCLILQKKGNST